MLLCYLFFLGNRTCSEIKYCNLESGSYVIDPVREGAVKPFKVSLTIPHGNGACPCPRLKKRARACSVISWALPPSGGHPGFSRTKQLGLSQDGILILYWAIFKCFNPPVALLVWRLSRARHKVVVVCQKLYHTLSSHLSHFQSKKNPNKANEHRHWLPFPRPLHHTPTVHCNCKSNMASWINDHKFITLARTNKTPALNTQKRLILIRCHPTITSVIE